VNSLMDRLRQGASRLASRLGQGVSRAAGRVARSRAPRVIRRAASAVRGALGGS